jgi:hypothetical protein
LQLDHSPECSIGSLDRVGQVGAGGVTLGEQLLKPAD